jgi:hypothetical protein
MFNSAILEVAVGVIFIYLLLSLLCTALREGLEGFLKTRAAYLEYGVRELLHDVPGKDLAREFYQHPLIYSLFPGSYPPPVSSSAPGALTRGGSLPSYIPAKNFAAALMDLVARGPSSVSPTALGVARPLSLQEVRSNVLKLDNLPVQRAVLTALDTASGDLEKARKNLEDWYDSAMDRVSGRYKRSTQLIVFVIGMLIAVGFNVNTIALADYLYRNQTQRGALVAQAQVVSDNEAFLRSNFKTVKDQIADMRLPIGWDQTEARTADENQPGEAAAASTRPVRQGFAAVWHDYLAPPIGWLLTAFAITLGAPFWFDILNKIMVIRSTVKPHEKSPEEASEDRQSERSTSTVTTASPTTVQIIREVQPAGVANPGDANDTDDDGCDATVDEPTKDNELPAAQGGVS